jgi:hypothetical protein
MKDEDVRRAAWQLSQADAAIAAHRGRGNVLELVKQESLDALKNREREDAGRRKIQLS